MIHHLSVFLLLQACRHLACFSNQFVNDGLEHNVEVLHQQIVLLSHIDGYVLSPIEERIAEIPELNGLIREILVFYLLQPNLSETVQIALELSSRNQLIVAVYLHWEAVVFIDIVQDGEEDDQQFFVKVYLALFVDRVHIDGTVVLHHSVCPCNSPSPVYLVETSVHVLDDEQKELLVVIVELYQRQ